MLAKIGQKFVNLGSSMVAFIKRKLWPMNYFTSIADVYADLNEGDKVLFLIRHSERTSDTSVTGPLTENGIQYAKDVGAMLVGGIADKNDISLLASEDASGTGFKRTMQTAYYVMVGRGDDAYSDYTELPHSIELEGSRYCIQKNVSGWEDYSKYAYNEPYQNSYIDVTKDIDAFLLNYLKTTDKTINIMVSHDQLLEIYTVKKCQEIGKQDIGLRFWDGAINDGVQERRWITYLAGMCIIKRADGSIEWVPVRGLSKGYQTGY